MKKPSISIQKPTLPAAAALDFATGATNHATTAIPELSQGESTSEQGKRPQTAKTQTSGLVPAGDVRLTANISEEHHIKLKIAAAKQRTTIGELIEQLIDKAL